MEPNPEAPTEPTTPPGPPPEWSPPAPGPEVPVCHVFYRLSSGGYPKEKPAWITKQGCLANFVRTLEATPPGALDVRLNLICDNCDDDLLAAARRLLARAARAPCVRETPRLERTKYGHGAGSFRHAWTLAKRLADASESPRETVYFVEDDYLHLPTPDTLPLLVAAALAKGLATGYDHPDKYRPGHPLPTPERTRVHLVAGRQHFRETGSTTMTFLATLHAVRVADPVVRSLVPVERGATHPPDFHLWCMVTAGMGNTLVSAVPALCTHGETKFLSPGIDWERVAKLEAEPE